jgi:Arc-like DNA binding domain
MKEEEKTVRFELRLPASLRQKLEERAREHHRSLNSEIVHDLGLGLNSDETLQKMHELRVGIEHVMTARIMSILADGFERVDAMRGTTSLDREHSLFFRRRLP